MGRKEGMRKEEEEKEEEGEELIGGGERGGLEFKLQTKLFY